MKHHSRITPVQPIDNCGDEACEQWRSTADPHLPHAWIGEEFNVLDTLPQLVKGGMAAVDYGAAELGEFGTMRVTLQETHTKRMLQVADRSRYNRVRDCEFACRLGHA